MPRIPYRPEPTVVGSVRVEHLDDAGKVTHATDPEDVAPAEPASNAEVRAWANDNQIEVSASGPVSKAVRELYEEAHGVEQPAG